jgi:hypothetical protein
MAGFILGHLLDDHPTAQILLWQSLKVSLAEGLGTYYTRMVNPH